MTFKLTEKDIEAIEVIVSDYASGMQADKVSDKNNVGNATMLRSFLKHWSRFRELEAREAVR